MLCISLMQNVSQVNFLQYVSLKDYQLLLVKNFTFLSPFILFKFFLCSMKNKDHIFSVLQSCVIAFVPVYTHVKSPSISTMQSHIPDRDFIVATATLVNVTICFHNSAVYCSILNETYDMLQQQETIFWIHKFLIACAIPKT